MPRFREAHLRHAHHYADVLYAADTLYQKGHESLPQGLGLFDQEWSNIQLGQVWAATSARHDDDAASLCMEYPERGAYCLNLRQKPEERIEWLKAALAAAQKLGNRYAEGNLLNKLALAYIDLGDFHLAARFCGQRTQIARETDDLSGQLEGWTNLGIVSDRSGDPGRAINCYAQALSIARHIGERRAEGGILGNLGMAYAALDQYDQALEYYDQHLTIAREIGDRRAESNALVNLGIAYRKLGQPQRAIECHEQALAISRLLGDRQAEAQDLGNLGLAYEAIGDLPHACECYEQRLQIAQQIGDRRGEALAHWNLGEACVRLNDLPSALHHLQLAVDIEYELGDPAAEQDATLVKRLRSKLNSQTFVAGETSHTVDNVISSDG